MDYGSHSLQNVCVLSSRPAGFWIVYVHGGAWRDPKILAPSFTAAHDVLLASAAAADIAGVASINYRLSAHPSYPQDPAAVPAAEYRSARHPEHIADVQAALALLQRTYGFGERYVLVGHSCGATLAFQAVMDRIVAPADVVRPLAIVGVAGIYDVPLLVRTMGHVSAYREFVTEALGEEGGWREVSPAPDAAGGVVESWRNGRVAVLARSVNDELMHAEQLPAMGEVLRAWAAAGGGVQRKVVTVEDLVETHDGIWSRGEELAGLILTAIEELRKMRV